MAKPFSQLPNILEERRKKFLRGVDLLSRDAARDAGSAAVDFTRVDTGRARSNWVASVGTPSSSVIPPYVPGNKLGTGERGNALGATNQHRLTIAGWKPTREIPLFIANNLPYIFSLNFGGSGKTADNMLAGAVVAWRLSFRLKVKKAFRS